MKGLVTKGADSSLFSEEQTAAAGASHGANVELTGRAVSRFRFVSPDDLHFISSD